MGRRVWSDPKVLELSQHFVPAADEVWRLQNDSEPECLFFRRSVIGDEAPVKYSTQGIYVFAPSGKLLVRRNSNDPKAIAELLAEGWAKWLELPDMEKQLTDPAFVESGFRWEQSYPFAGLHLRRTARDLPADNDVAAKPAERFNRDAVWFSAAEARSMLPLAPELAARVRFSDVVTKRLSCLVLVDNARGQTVPYHPSEDNDSELWSEVTGVAGKQITVRITGQTSAVAKGPWLLDEASLWTPPKERRTPHSIRTSVLGSATFDLEQERFVAFELLALGERTGRTVNQGRTSDAPSGIGFVCELAPSSWRVAPTFIDAYDVEWVTEPE